MTKKPFSIQDYDTVLLDVVTACNMVKLGFSQLESAVELQHPGFMEKHESAARAKCNVANGTSLLRAAIESLQEWRKNGGERPVLNFIWKSRKETDHENQS